MSPTEATEKHGGRVRGGRFDVAVLLVCAAVLAVMRLHAFSLPLETDEANYAYIGGRLLAGDRLYVDVWDHQPPGVFVLFAAAACVFGDEPFVFRCLSAAFSLATLFLIWAILRQRGGRGAGEPAYKRTAWAAAGGALLFALASSDPGTAGEGCNREIYMNALILAGWWCVMRRPSPTTTSVLVAGLLLGLASTFKTIVAVHWFCLAGWFIWSMGRRMRPDATGMAGAPHKPTAHRLISIVLWFAAGPLAIWLAVFGYFAVTGRFSEFYEAVFRFNMGYSQGGDAFVSRFTQFFQPDRHPFIFDSAVALWLGGIVSAFLLPVVGVFRRDHAATAVFALLAAGYITICLPAQFWPHYYYLLIPPLAVAVPMAAALVGDFVARCVARLGTGGAAWATPVILAGLACWLGYTQWRDYVSRTPYQITVKRYNSRDFFGRAHGYNVARVTDPSDTIFVFGNDTGIYYYSKRRCASRYTMATGLREEYHGADRRRVVLLKELERNRPRIILETGERHFEDWLAFLQRHYEPIGVDLHDRRRVPIMPVWGLKDRPVARVDWDWDRSQIGVERTFGGAKR